MSRASPAHLNVAAQLLVHEGGDGAGAEAWAAAAGRIHDKLHAELAPLLGASGVEALMARSARLARHQHASLSDVAVVETSTGLRECLAGLESGVAMETARALFGTFFTLITTFIGERLTVQALRSAWPTIEEMAAGETTK